VSLYEAATIDGASPWQQFRYITFPMLTPIIAVVMTFSVLFTFTDFQLIYVLTRGGPLNATHLMATLSFQRAIPGGQLGEGAAIAVAMIPFLLAAILFSYFGLQRRRWQHGGRTEKGEPMAVTPQEARDRIAARLRASQAPKTAATGDSEGMDYLVSVPRRVFTVYLPLLVFVFVLLFPFYWMTVTAFKSNAELYNFRDFSPFWVVQPTLQNINKLFFETSYPRWLWNTMLVSTVATFLSLFCSVFAAYAIERLRFKGARITGMVIFLAYLVPPSILFIPLATMVFAYGIFDTPLALILTYPTFLIPFCTWLLMGYFRTIPYELEECALIDGASRLQILVKIMLPLAVPGLISAGIFAFTLSWNEFIYALTFISSSENKTVPVGVITELVEGDVYHWGSLMAGALMGSLPVAILYSFFVEHYVSSMTGAVKE
jgi:multiple sugar transport system permease protein